MSADPVLGRYRRTLTAYRARASLGLTGAWEQLHDYDDADLERFTRRTAPLLAGVKAATVATSAGFFALTLKLPPVGVRPDQVDVDPNISGPFLAMWHALKEGRPFEEAVTVGRSTADATGFDFVQSTARRTGDHVAEASGRRVRWRRATGTKACAWCIEAADGTFRTAESTDFGHERCDCVAVPT